jgi:TPR repeat protein
MRRTPFSRPTALLAALALTWLPSLAFAEDDAQRFALLVGVNHYKHSHLRDLQYAENDVTELAGVLKAARFQVVLLTGAAGKTDPGRAPTLANVQKHFAALLVRCGKHNTLLVALAGHGLQFAGIADNYFCPSDARPLPDEPSRRTLLSLGEVYRQMDESGAGVKLLLVDACREDPSPARSRGIDGSNSPRPPRGVAALFSCSAGERAYEHDRYRHGVFFHHVLDGLRGKARDAEGDVTWDGLTAYVRKQVAADVPRLFQGGAQQTPSLNAGELAGAPPVLIERSLLRVVPQESAEPDPNAPHLHGRPKLGVHFQPLHQASAAGILLPPRSQPQVMYVVPGGSADQMGLKEGDVLLEVDGRAVPSIAEASAQLRKHRLGERVELRVHRAGQALTLTGAYRTPFGAEEQFRRSRQDAERSPAAQVVIGLAYESGTGVSRDPAEAVRWYRRAADQGHATARFRLAVAFSEGRGVAKDDAECVRWARLAAEQGYPPAQMKLGWMYTRGRGVARDDREAVVWYRRAAEQEDPAAQNNLGWMYETGRGVPRDDGEAVLWYRRAAEHNQAPALCNLAGMYARGRGVARNDLEAVRLYQLSAERGYPRGQYNLGVMYTERRGGLAGDEEAARWYRKAAEQNYPDAQYQLGRAYERGLGVRRDFAEALRWYRLAAEQGVAAAQYNLGVMYADGKGVPRSDAEALKWYGKAAAQNHASAMYALGWMYDTGRGVPANRGEALRWYRKAAGGGSVDARLRLRQLGQPS